ncbi:sensor histidine kinase [Pseudonocardia endophytica]|uniref:histidine kinase n=1 Tax=Pseudonocardia endophytica TaxID=401976 RepID=A0A4R1HJR6_PSEEN|nr:GAF domain-containing sensor histidine kinase [Pseudonocardia endophytica]TCK22614.1 histidine kinase [Pseudonocardia endophytica]
MSSPSRIGTTVAFALSALVVLELGTGVSAAIAAGWTLSEAIDAFVVTNAAIGLSCGVAGVLIAWQRPRNPVGWLLLAAAVSQSGTVAGAPPLDLAVQHGASEPMLRTLATLSGYAWPWSIATFLPLALLLFPDGGLTGRFRRSAAALAVLNGPLFAVHVAGDGVAGDPVQPWLVIPAITTVGTAVEILNLLVYVLAVIGLVVRYRRGDEQRRRQLLWLVLALVLVVVVIVPWGLFDAGPILQLLAIALVPASIAVAVLRHQLLDIRLVLSRTVLYVVLTALVAATYLGLVTLANRVLAGSLPGNAVLAALVVAIAFHPVRVRLQRLVDRALYGDRSDPVRALSGMGERLRAGDPGDGIGPVLAAVCDALRLPSAAVVRDGIERARHGSPDGAVESVPLVYRGEEVGALVVGVRSGQRALDRTDRAALDVLAAPLAVAVRATELSASLQRSRERIVAAREEERRRLRRDLHDGLGPVLTGISFQADAAGNLLASDPARAAELLTALRAAATEAIQDVRRLVHDLRPPALDELGLVGALRQHADQLGAGAPAVDVLAPDELPPLPAAAEVAAYRIGAEALTNAVRHAGAGHVTLTIAVGDELELDVRDDGGSEGGWTPGVGLTSMTERAAELGGSVRLTAGSDGGRVVARLPLGSVVPADAVAEVTRTRETVA